VEYYEGKEEDIPKVIISRNALRRHLTKDQRDALIAAVLAPELEKEAAERKGGRPSPSKAGTFGKAEVKGSVAENLAKKMDISRRRAEQLEKVRKAGLMKSVATGKAKLRAAAKAAPRKVRAKKVKSMESRVWTAWKQLLAKFKHDELREVKKHLRNFLAGGEPKAE
jgi:hypothetical protein